MKRTILFVMFFSFVSATFGQAIKTTADTAKAAKVDSVKTAVSDISKVVKTDSVKTVVDTTDETALERRLRHRKEAQVKLAAADTIKTKAEADSIAKAMAEFLEDSIATADSLAKYAPRIDKASSLAELGNQPPGSSSILRVYVESNGSGRYQIYDDSPQKVSCCRSPGVLGVGWRKINVTYKGGGDCFVAEEIVQSDSTK